jgi:hypothetical protein
MKKSTCLMTLIKKLSLGIIVLAAPQIVMAENVPATVTSIKGDVSVTDASGKPVQVTQGSKLPAGDTVKTGATGVVGLTLVPGAGTVVQPNSTVKISSLAFNKGADGSNNRNIRLNLKNGTLISTLFKKDGHSDFQVATPYGVAAAKGTSWAVTVEGTSLTVQVANGVVTVTNNAGNVIATIPVGQGYDSTTGAVSTLPQSVVDGILAAIAEYLPNLTQQQVIDALNSATINPATVNSKDDINSPNGK